ncbi:MAG: ABC transporter ATP-binding protein [Cardiobacteriaceae bacterium]|nr:ABC transporter ATP-binding protein [Cardiobacteriaceae bacterium]
MHKHFENHTNPFPADWQSPPPRTLFAFVRHYCKGFYTPLWMIIITGIIIAMLEVLIFGFIGNIVDWLTASSRDTLLQDEGWKLTGMALVILVLLPLTSTISTVARNQMIMGNLPMAARWRMHNYLLGQSMGFYQDEFSGRVSAKVMQTALAVRAVATTCADIMVYAAAYFVSIIALMASQHWLLMMLIIAWIVAYSCILRHYLPLLRDVSEAQADARSTMTGRVTDAYTNIATVKLFAHTQREALYARDAMREFLGTVHHQFRLVTNLDILINVLNYCLIFAIAAVGITLWMQGQIAVGAIAAAVGLASRMNGMSHWIMWEIGGLAENVGTVADGMNMLARPITVQDKAGAQELRISDGRIEFDHVSFGYSEKEEKHVLHDLSLNIRPGEKIGLVGRSGAGKSTLVNTLMRFYDLDSGEIRIDGQNIADVTQDSLRRNIAMVTQDTSLLHRSVRDNILYGRPNASEAELQQAIIRAEADDFINDLTDQRGNTGLDAQVGERGVKLSGGQRQRIAIARVLLKDAPILILDEATSALDSEVEAAIQHSLNQLMEGKTVIAIAHRLSTIAAMDRLIILDAGRIVEQGSHDELLAQNGIYAQLWSRQTGGYLGEA